MHQDTLFHTMAADALMKINGYSSEAAFELVNSFKTHKQLIDYIDRINNVPQLVTKPFAPSVAGPAISLVKNTMQLDWDLPQNKERLNRMVRGIMHGEESLDYELFVSTLKKRSMDPKFYDTIEQIALSQMKANAKDFIQYNQDRLMSQKGFEQLQGDLIQFTPFEMKGWENCQREMSAIKVIGSVFPLDENRLKAVYTQNSATMIQQQCHDGDPRYEITSNCPYINANTKSLLLDGRQSIFQMPRNLESYARNLLREDLTITERIQTMDQRLEHYRFDQQGIYEGQSKESAAREFKKAAINDAFIASMPIHEQSPLGVVLKMRETQRTVDYVSQSLKLNYETDGRQPQLPLFRHHGQNSITASAANLSNVFLALRCASQELLKDLNLDGSHQGYTMDFKGSGWACSLRFEQDKCELSNRYIIGEGRVDMSQFMQDPQKTHNLAKSIEQEAEGILSQYAKQIFQSQGIVLTDQCIEKIDMIVAQSCEKFGLQSSLSRIIAKDGPEIPGCDDPTEDFSLQH